MRFDGDGNNGYYKVLTVEPAEPGVKSDALKEFRGKIKLGPSKNFGFVEDVFIEPQNVAQKKLSNGQWVEGKAMLSFNKKKKQWGWKAIEMVAK